MLKEVEAVKQQPGEDFCRWFSDEYFDLYVWINPSGAITGFQLCYDKPGDEHAFTWFSNKGSFHHRINPGDHNPAKNQTPILVQDGIFQGDEVERRFAESSKTLDVNLAAFVIQKLREYRDPSRAAHAGPAPGILTTPVRSPVKAGMLGEAAVPPRRRQWLPVLSWLVKAILGIFLLFALLLAYGAFKARWAQRQVETFCGQVTIGEPVQGYEAKAKDYWLEIRHLPERTEKDGQRRPARMLVWEGFVFDRWFCEIGHAGGKVISKKVVFLD